MSGANSELPREVVVALSLLRSGVDTRAARLFREAVVPEWSGACSDWLLLERLADALQLRAGERRQRLEQARASATRAVQSGERLGITILSVLDSGYPGWLRQIADPPIVLWVRGAVPVLDRPAVAVVGSRNATAAGLSSARRLSKELALAGLVVVSGMARGVDGAAHRGALDAGQPTVAVLGSGTDVSYPREHRGLGDQIAGSGALVSEFPPGTLPYPSHFPLRNRIISGLSRAVVVVEASERSGSLITARAALEQGRDVLAVPGSVVSGCYRGCHALIKDGAGLVETVDDILEELGWRRAPRSAPPENGQKSNNVNTLEAHLGSGNPMSVDELAARTSRPASECLAELGLLEIAGKVARRPNGSFVRVDGPATYINRGCE